MRKLQRITGLTAVLMIAVAAVLPSGTRAAPRKDGPVVVGRVTHVEGEVLRYVFEEKDWVPITKDVPFGLEDSLYTDPNAKAEITFPNSTWIRIGGNTQIQAIELDDDVTEVDVASGLARLYNRGRDGVIKATTPFGYVLAPAGAMFDLYVGDESVEVIALRESVDFVHGRNESRYEVKSGSSSLIADNRTVAAGQATVDADFDDWNAQRDSLWAKRLEVKGDSTRYLPAQLYDDAYEFEENGRWERVQYAGEYRNLWRPTRVASDWSPYTYGRWTSYYGDQCWVPSESFGYVTHHYGSWVFIDSCRCWYWAPPVASINIAVGRPWTVGYGWYPGRVSWIYSDANVGWAPLAPYEPYYANRYWGPTSVAVATLNLATAVVNLATLHHLDHAVFVGRRDFWGVDNYHNHVVRNINRTTIINNYYASPVVDRRVIRDFDSRRDRFNFVNRNVTIKPHRSVVERIDMNQRLAARQERLEARALLANTRNVRQGTVDQSVRVERPRVSNRLVSADSVDRPASELRFQQRELKRQERQQRAIDQRVLRTQQQEERLQKRDELQQPREDQQLQRQERQQQLEERRRSREERIQTRPERPDADQRQQQLEERRRSREERIQTRPERPDADQRQQQLEERRRLREERIQTRPERPDADQRRQMQEERQQQMKNNRQMLEQRQQQLQQQRQQQQQMRQQRPQQDREQQQQMRQQQMERQQQMQNNRQMLEERRQQLQQQRQQRQEPQQQQQNRKRPRGQEEQPQEGAQPQ